MKQLTDNAQMRHSRTSELGLDTGKPVDQGWAQVGSIKTLSDWWIHVQVQDHWMQHVYSLQLKSTDMILLELLRFQKHGAS